MSTKTMNTAKRYAVIAGVSIGGLILLNTLANRFNLGPVKAVAKLTQTGV